MGRWSRNLLGGDLDGAGVDVLLDLAGVLAVDGAANRGRGAENLEDGALEVLGEGAGPHDAGDLVDLVKGDVTAVGNVLDLLPVTWGLLEIGKGKGKGKGK